MSPIVSFIRRNEPAAIAFFTPATCDRLFSICFTSG